MRVLHAALLKYASPGIVNQMYWESLSAQDLGIQWRSILCVTEIGSKIDNRKSRVIKLFNKDENWFSLRKKYYDWLLSEQDNYDILVLRHSSATPQEYFFLKKIKKPVFLVHHTLEQPEILSYMNKSILNASIKYFFESYFGGLALKRAENIICVTNEIFNYQNNRIGCKFKNKIIYPNGILFDEKLAERNLDFYKAEIPQILFVAGHFSSWHGLDLILDNLTNTKADFTLHVVGEVDEKDKLKAQQDSRVILHGSMNKQELKTVMDRAWIGLSSFALSRKKMSEACTLKVREYLFNGLPVYSGHKDVFPEDFEFYKFGRPDMNTIIDFAYEMKEVSRKEVRYVAEPYINKKDLLRNLYAELEKKFKNS